MTRKTRQIEMLVAETHGDSNGQWWTEYIDIPEETLEENIEDVSCKAWWRKYKRNKRTEAIAGLMVYWIPEIEEDDEL